MSEMVVEKQKNTFGLLGLSLTKPVYSASPVLRKTVVVETVSGSLLDTYILLEEWGLWTAAGGVGQGLGTVRERAVFYIDDGTALKIDRCIARCRKRDPSGDSNFNVLRAVYVERKRYRDITRALGINSALIRGVVSNYAFSLDAVIFEGDNAHKKNIKKILDMRGGND